MFGVQELTTSIRHVLVVLVLVTLAAWMLVSLIRLIPRRSGFSIGDFAVKGETYVPETSAALALEFR